MEINTDNLKHIAFIMDGNGRWAKLQNKKRTYGHKKGVENVITILRECERINISCVSFFCFSTENWKRPKEEIDKLFHYLELFFKKNIKEFIQKNIKIQVSGDYLKLPQTTIKVINKAIKLTKNLNKMTFNVCLNYGGKDDIVNATKNILIDYSNNKLNLDNLNESLFSKYLYTRDLPQVDLLIRTSGEERLSNFMLYQLAYAELIFEKEYWPDFSIENLHNCINIYNNRIRKFGEIDGRK